MRALCVLLQCPCISPGDQEIVRHLLRGIGATMAMGKLRKATVTLVDVATDAQTAAVTARFKAKKDEERTTMISMGWYRSRPLPLYPLSAPPLPIPPPCLPLHPCSAAHVPSLPTAQVPLLSDTMDQPATRRHRYLHGRSRGLPPAPARRLVGAAQADGRWQSVLPRLP